MWATLTYTRRRLVCTCATRITQEGDLYVCVPLELTQVDLYIRVPLELTQEGDLCVI